MVKGGPGRLIRRGGISSETKCSEGVYDGSKAEKNILKGLEAKGFCVGESAFLENVVAEAARDI